jgi:hypothetical protein
MFNSASLKSFYVLDASYHTNIIDIDRERQSLEWGSTLVDHE